MIVKDILQNSTQWIPNKNYATCSPLVSVLLPTYNRGQKGFFQRAVKSVLAQTHIDLELIIVDDSSTDDTPKQIENFMRNDPRVHCLQHAYNIGLPAISEFEAFQKASGRYIAFMFDDNEWEMTALEKTLTYMQKKEIKASYGVAHLITNQERNEYVELGVAHGIDYLVYTNVFANGAVVLHREVLERVGLFDPHISLTRVCDWDLWRRIAKKYDFVGTGIFFTIEYGFILNDSLGNSLYNNIWIAEEYMQIRRDALLAPEKIEHLNIVKPSNARSKFFIDGLAQYTQKFVKKKWFKQDIVLRDLSEYDSNIRKIVLLGEFTASTSLCFDRIFHDTGHVIRYCSVASSPMDYLGLADILVIISRNFHNLKREIALTKALGIPCYIFIDDNYHALLSDFPYENEIGVLAGLFSKENLALFSGVITVSSILKKYIQEKSLHSHVLLLEPSIDDTNIYPFTYGSDNTKQITVAFMGGAWRKEILFSCVLPALKKLSRDYNLSIRFICPEDADSSSRLNDFSDTGLTIVRIPRSLSIDVAINRFAAFEVNILVHCGPNLENNLYKTRNALLNAVQLGAVLIASDCPPFVFDDKEGLCYLLAKNTPEDWYLQFSKIFKDMSLRENMYRRALHLCNSRYSPKHTEKELDNELKLLEGPSFLKTYNRLIKLNAMLESEKNAQSMDCVAYFSHPKIESDKLCYLAGLNGEKKFRIFCDLPSLNSIGFIFSGKKKIKGKIKFIIFFKGIRLRETVINMEDLEFNHWSYFSFPSLLNCAGRILDVVLNFQYEENDEERLGIYEDISKISLLHKVIKKLKINIFKNNSVYYCLQ